MDLVLTCFLWAATLFISAGGLLMMVIIIATAVKIGRDSIRIKRNKHCKWRSSDLSEYSTGCGKVFFNSDEGNPVTDWAKFCPYCGKEIEE